MLNAITSIAASSTSALPQFIRLFGIVCFTLEEALLSSALALAIGLPAAFFVARRKFAGRALINALSSVPLCMPPMFIALGFILCYGTNGCVTHLLLHIARKWKAEPAELQFTFLYSFWGLVIVQGFYNFPIVMRIAADSYRHEPREVLDAARLLGASKQRIFMTITLFHLKSAILAAASLVFLYCFFSFIIVLLLGNLASATIEVEIYSAARTQMDFSYAAALAIIETAIALVVVSLYTTADKLNTQSRGFSMAEPLKNVSAFTERACLALLLFLIAAFLLAPIASIAFSAFASFKPFFRLLTRGSFYHALINTVVIASFTALLSTALGTMFALIMRFKYRGIFLRVIAMLPLAVSPIVMSFCFMCILPASNPIVLVAAQTALEWPFAYRQVSSQAENINDNIADCAFLLSEHSFFAVRHVFLPLCSEGILSAFAFAFAISCSDAAIPLMLAIPRFETLSLYLYRLSGAYRFAESSCCAIVLCIITTGVFALGRCKRK